MLDRSDLFPRDGKCQHAFCIDVDRAGDIRVLANVVPGQQWMDTMLHELGHATFDAGLDPSLPWLLRDTHLVVTEGIAILMGRLASDAEWLRAGGRASIPAAVAAIADALRAARAAEMLVFTRWVLVMTNFERSLYADPESDLDARWWELVERYQLVSAARPAAATRTGPRRSTSPARPSTTTPTSSGTSSPRSSPRPSSGSAAGSSTAPRRAGCSPSGCSRPGLSVRWDRLIEQATGEPLSAVALRARHRRRPERSAVVAMMAGGTASTTSASSRTTSRRRSASTSTSSGSSRSRPRTSASPSSGCAPGTARSTSSSGRATPPSHAHFGLEIDEFMPVYRRMKELGALDHVTFGNAMYELPDGGIQMYVRDPAGNLVELDHPRRVHDPPRRGAGVQAARRPQPAGRRGGEVDPLAL